MTALSVHSLHIYPIKGVRGVELQQASVLRRGLQHDRRWLIVDADNKFITQRENSALATIDAQITDKGLRLSSSDHENRVDITSPESGERVSVSIWRDRVDAVVADQAASDWVSTILGQKVRLVFMDSASDRRTSEQWGRLAPVSFADGYPILITTTGSLSALNKKIEASGGSSVSMDRFRPNIVINDNEPWAEDHWRYLRIGDVTFELVKPCDRCVVTTKDQDTGETMGKEPLKTLAKIRLSADERVSGVLFGWNTVPKGEGVIRVGDNVTVTEKRSEPWPIAAA